MRAVVQRRYGGPESLSILEIDPPKPADDEVLIRVQASSVNPADWHLMRGQPFLARVIFGGLRKPKRTRQGRDVAGVVEAVGTGVTTFEPGDEVFGHGVGAFADLVATKEGAIARKPANIPFEEAAAVPVAGLTALQALRDVAKLQRGQRLLMNGASGGVGSFAVQIAKAWGASVTAVTSTRNVERVRGLGADEVVDYTREDFVKGGRRFDVVFDCAGNRSETDLLRVTVPGGIVVPNGGNVSTGAIVLGFVVSAIRSRLGPVRIASFITNPNGADLAILAGMLEDGSVKPLIDRSYPLEQIREAVAYMETLHARGKVIVKI